MMKYTVEATFAGPGVHRMTYQGPVEARSSFDRVCHEHRFEDRENETQAIYKTGTRFLPDTELSKLMEMMFDTQFKRGDVVDLESLLGKDFEITIKDINGLSRVVSVSPSTEGETE